MAPCFFRRNRLEEHFINSLLENEGEKRTNLSHFDKSCRIPDYSAQTEEFDLLVERVRLMASSATTIEKGDDDHGPHPLWRSFHDGFASGISPFRPALKTALGGMALSAVLLLFGGLLVMSAAFSPLGPDIVETMGEALMLAGGLAGIVTAFAAWREMFRKTWSGTGQSR